jgi:hypothetical protein
MKQWQDRLGPKYKMRVGISWSGRRDAWLNQHKGVPFDQVLSMIQSHPEYEWISLQVDATPDEEQALADAGQIDRQKIAEAIKKYNINVQKPNPMTS